MDKFAATLELMTPGEIQHALQFVDVMRRAGHMNAGVHLESAQLIGVGPSVLSPRGPGGRPSEALQLAGAHATRVRDRRHVYQAGPPERGSAGRLS